MPPAHAPLADWLELGRTVASMQVEFGYAHQGSGAQLAIGETVIFLTLSLLPY